MSRLQSLHGRSSLFRAKLGTEFIEAVRAATNGGLTLGDERFKRQIAKRAGTRADKLPLGRPPAKRTDKRQKSLLSPQFTR